MVPDECLSDQYNYVIKTCHKIVDFAACAPRLPSPCSVFRVELPLVAAGVPGACFCDPSFRCARGTLDARCSLARCAGHTHGLIVGSREFWILSPVLGRVPHRHTKECAHTRLIAAPRIARSVGLWQGAGPGWGRCQHLTVSPLAEDRSRSPCHSPRTQCGV